MTTDPDWRKLPRKPGAGRKPQLPGGTVKTSVSLSQDDRDYLQAIDENISGAIRKLVERDKMSYGSMVTTNEVDASEVCEDVGMYRVSGTRRIFETWTAVVEAANKTEARKIAREAASEIDGANAVTGLIDFNSEANDVLTVGVSIAVVE